MADVNIPTAAERRELFLQAVANGDVAGCPMPVTREEQYLYYIAANGGGGGGGGWKLPDFSTEEQPLGVKWVDGKDLYIKTFIGTKGESALYIPLENVDTVIPITATIQSGTNIFTPFYTSTSNFFKLSFDVLSGVRRIYVNTTLTNADYKIVVIYTKVEN